MKPLSNVQLGTLGGTICSVLSSFDWGNLAHTALLAMVGAAVSYFTSRLLQGRRRRR